MFELVLVLLIIVGTTQYAEKGEVSRPPHLQPPPVVVGPAALMRVQGRRTPKGTTPVDSADLPGEGCSCPTWPAKMCCRAHFFQAAKGSFGSHRSALLQRTC